MRTLSLVLLVVLWLVPSRSQSVHLNSDSGSDSIGAVVSDSVARVSITSHPPGVDVYLNSHSAGRTPLHRVIARSETLVVRLFSPAVNHWRRIEKIDTIQTTKRAIVEGHYVFDNMRVITSIPSGATVVQGTRPIGVTPLAYYYRDPIDERFAVRKIGFEESILSDLSQVSPMNPIRLRPIEIDLKGKHADFVLEGDDEGGLHGGLVYTAAGTMIVSGILAAYLKDSGNRRFDEYLRTNDPSLLQSTRRYDKAAGIAVAITQVSLGLLAYLVLTE